MLIHSTIDVAIMIVWLWVLVLIAAVWAADWGADHLADPLRKLRRQWGLTGVAGGALLAIVTASPEVGINAASAIRGVSDIGLGNMLGSNIISLPLIFTIAYLASRREFTGSNGSTDGSDLSTDGDAGNQATNTADNGNGNRSGSDSRSVIESQAAHNEHRREHLVRLESGAVTELALPYLGILGLVALLTLPAPWRGLQPIDGWIMLAAYGVYLAQAVLRGREAGEAVEWTRRELLLAGAGIGALIAGAYFTVRATENIVSALGIPGIIGGLFITATMSTAPEVFKTWSVVKSGQVTAGTTSVIADNAVTVTIGFFPLALVSVPVGNYQLYWVNLLFVALMPAAFAVLTHFGSDEHGLKRWQVLTLDSVYLIYLAVMLFSVLNIL